MDMTDMTDMADTTPQENVDEDATELVLLIVGLVFAILSVITDLMIAYVIMRLRSLRTPQNIFLVCWMLSDILKIAAKVWYVMLDESDPLEMSMAVSYYAFGTTCNLFVMVIVADWYCANFFTTYSEDLRKRYKIVIAIIVVVTLIIFTDGAISAVVYKKISFMAQLLILGLMVVCAVFTMAAQCYAGCSTTKTTGSYILFATALYTIPMVTRYSIYVLFEEFFDDFGNMEMLLFLFQYCSFIRNCVIMWKHKEVCDAIKKLVRCSGLGESNKCDDFHKGFVNPTCILYSNAENGMVQ